MPKVFIADAATRKAEYIDRNLTNRFLAEHQTEAERLELEERQKADALNHATTRDAYAGNSINVEGISTEALAGEIGGGGKPTEQEAEIARKERKAARKRNAKLGAMELSEHTAQAWRREIRYLEARIENPRCDAERQADAARLDFILRRFGEAKIFETRIAPLMNCSKSSAERTVKAGQEIWANLIRIALNRCVDPAEALPYLQTLPQSLQHDVAFAAEYQREIWAVEHQLALWARAPKLCHGTLDSLPHEQLCDPVVRKELSILDAPEKARRIAAMRLDAERAKEERERKATTRDRERDARFAAINTNLGSLCVQTFTTMTAADRTHFLTVMGLAPANTLSE
jgi:uncharacterized small protein (DUF1192 family)